MRKIDWPVVIGVLILIVMASYLAFMVGYDMHAQKYKNDIERRYEK